MKSSMTGIKRIKDKRGETVYVYKGVKIRRVKCGGSICFRVDGDPSNYCLLSTALHFINKKLKGG